MSGRILLSDGEPASFASVRATAEESGKLKGDNCDENGRYNIRLEPGNYKVSVYLLGYSELDTLITVAAGRMMSCDFVLQEKPGELGAVQVFADRRGLAREIARKAIDARTQHFKEDDATRRYTMHTRTSVQMLGPDTTKLPSDSLQKEVKRKDRQRVMTQYFLQESQSEVFWMPPARFNEKVIAVNEFNKYPPSNSGSGASVSFSYGESDIIPQQWMSSDSYVLRSYQGFQEFNIYNRLLHVPSVCQKKILSPIGEGAMLSYRYNLAGVRDSAGVKIYTVTFEGIFPGEPLLTGEMRIRASDWALLFVEASLSAEVMDFFNDFRLTQYFSTMGDSSLVPVSQQLQYTVKDGLDIYYGKVGVVNEGWDIDQNYRFTDETLSYDVRAFDRDSLYWAAMRKFELDEIEQSYAHACDSIQRHYASDEYFEEIDSTYNALRWQDFVLFGIGYRNRARDYSFYINPLTMQVNPLGIGGYRHRLGGTFEKNFENAYTLEVEGEADYGFRNQDLRGRGGVGLTYIPLKFVRTFLRFGDYYDMVNNYASLGSLFSRSNYVRTRTWSIAQRLEVINGLFAELTFDFSDQQPIINLLSDRWSQQVFGDINSPLDFERYIKSEFKLELKYRHKQKYIIKKGRKILLGTVYPDVKAVYRKGIPGLLNSEVDFDYIELGLKHSKVLGRLGDFEWSALAGSFVNKRNLRLLEHRYFRGSDVFFFSDPLNSFQLLGPTLSTPNAFLRANYFHHLNGLLLNKIPLIHRLRITEAMGAGVLSIPDEGFYHLELYAGIERVVRIRNDLFRFGIYAATADNTLEKASFELKFGINFYNSFTKRWQY